MINSVIRLLSIALLLAPIPALAAADPAHIQFCWTIGKFDHTVYYAEVEVTLMARLALKPCSRFQVSITTR